MSARRAFRPGWRAAGLHALGVLALSATFLVALVLGVLIHADLKVARRLAGRAIQRALRGAVPGTIVTAGEVRVGPTHVSLPSIELFDLHSRRVARLSGVDVDVSLYTLVKDLVRSQRRPTIVLDHVRVERSEVDLLTDPDTGEPTLVSALVPKKAAPGAPATAGGEPVVVLRGIELGRATVHERLAGAPALDGELQNVHGRLWVLPKRLAIDVDRFGIAVHGGERLEARGTGTFVLRDPGPVRATFQGFVGDVELAVAAALEGGKVRATADLPGASPEAVSRLVPGWPLREALSGHVEADGEPSRLHTVATLHAGSSVADVDGQVTTGTAPGATFSVKARHVDARLFSADAPATDASVGGTLTVQVQDGRLTTHFVAHTDPTVVSDEVVPAIDVVATLAEGELTGSAEVHEPTLPFQATFHVTPSGADVEATAKGVDLSRVRRLGRRELGGTARARLRVHVEHGTLRSSLDADVANLSVPGATLRRAHLESSATSPLTDPMRLAGTARLEGSDGEVSGAPVDRVVVDARGSREALHFDAHLVRGTTMDLRATGTAALAGRPALHGVQVSLKRDPVTMSGTVKTLDLATGTVDVEDVHVSGAGGAVTGSVHVGREGVEIAGKGENVELDALQRALGLPRGTLEGKASIDADIVEKRGATRGRVHLTLHDAILGPVGGASLELSATLDDRAVKGKTSGTVAGIGTFEATFDGRLAGRLRDPMSFRKATGVADVTIGDVKLDILSALLPKESPIDQVSGTASAHLLLNRKTAEAPLPDVFATVKVADLSLGVRDAPPERRRIALNVTATGTLDGTTGSSSGTTVVDDAHGRLLAATGSVELDLAALLKAPARAFADLLGRPVELNVSMPRRKLATIPLVGTGTSIAGDVAANVNVRGTLSEPTLFASVDGFELAPGAPGASRPVDLHADGQYQWDTRAAAARTTVLLAGRPVASGTFRGALPEGLAQWTGDARLDLSGLPVDQLGALANARASGQLFGTVMLSRDPSGGGAIGAEVRIVDAAVERGTLGNGQLHVVTSGDVASATLRFAGGEGTLEVNGTAPVSFHDPLPKLGHDAPIGVHLVAHDFGAVALSPLVTGVLTRLGGRFDADLTLALAPAHDGEAEWTGGVQGTASLREGSLLIEALGLEVRDASCSLEAHGQGADTELAVRDVRGRVRSSNDNVRAEADLFLHGMKLVRGTGSLDADDVPILFRGAPQGRVTGRAEAKLSRDGERILVDIDVPRLVTKLPQASTRKVIVLGDNPDITIVQLEAPPAEERAITPWRLAVHLGRDVSLRRNDVELFVSGEPVIDLGEQTEIGGTLDIAPGGRVPVLGKVFIVDHGQVIFDTGEADNPRVDVSASWRAPNDTMVYVEVTGTLREGKLALRSDPPLPEPEVFALILGGSSSETEQTTATSTENGSNAAGAVAIGGSVAALGVNQLIGASPVELRVETTSQALPRYTAAVRIRPNLWFEASEYTQQIGPGGGTDRNVVSGTVDYRFTRRWSLRTEVGTAGGALDLLWQYRY